jgi:succinate---hydroxymethylglutarate CoA-transferase
LDDQSAQPAQAGAKASVRPLEGVRVLEFTHFAVGPFASMQLADWGADVVKVEPPGGEALRDWPPVVAPDDPQAGKPYGMYFATLNRNKRSVVIDLKDPAGLERALRLSSQAHIVLENFRPGVMDKLGLGYEDLRKVNPSIVYCSITGYGQSGPLRDKGAFDIAIQGTSGIMSVTGDDDGAPAKCGVPIADYGTGTFAALSCMVALRHAERTGQPSHVDVSMLACMLSLSCLQTSEYWGSGVVPSRMGSRHPTNSPYQAFRGSDGKWFILAAGSDRLWGRLCELLGQPALAEDERFTTPAGRAGNQKLLGDALQRMFVGKSAADWLELFDGAQIPSAPVLDYAEVLSSEHVRETGLIHTMPLPNGRMVPAVGNPIGMSGYQFEVYRPPAQAGQHDQEVDAEWQATYAAQLPKDEKP